MGGYYINFHVKTSDAPSVRELLTAAFVQEGFLLIGSEAAATVTEDEDKLPPGDGWYGVLVSGASSHGWVSVYVADWADSGFLAKRLSQSIGAPVLEVWVADDIHWGYTYYENGAVKDRFADDPAPLADTEAEAALYAGQVGALAPILRVPTKQVETILSEARSQAGQFAGGPLDALAQAVGLPFEHIFTGYDYFFEDDPDDYSQDLEHWPEFRHLAFQPPVGRETLSE